MLIPLPPEYTKKIHDRIEVTEVKQCTLVFSITDRTLDKLHLKEKGEQNKPTQPVVNPSKPASAKSMK